MRTKDRIHGSTDSNTRCALCNVYDEDHNHLFFNCTYSTDVWTVVASKARISWPIRPWEQLWAWTIREFGSMSNPRHCMAGLVLASTVYGLWAERNHRVHSLVYRSPHKVSEEIIQSIRLKLTTITSKLGVPTTDLRRRHIG